MLLGVDIGGTFTDFVLVDDSGRVRLLKRPTSAADPAVSFLEGVAELGLGEGAEVVHGSTIATNALLERRGARTALITTRGFADVLEIGRQNRPDLYALVPAKPPPLVPREWRFELPERVTADGQVLTPLDPQSVDALLPRLAAARIESVAVCFLFSFLRPEHERLVKERLEVRDWGLEIGPTDNHQSPFSDLQPPQISLSSELLPEYREYERTSTTVINAYVAPLIDRYLSRLEAGLGGRRLFIMQSNGGTISAGTARAQAARMALSGPAGGVVGAFHVAREASPPAPSPGPVPFGPGEGAGGEVRVITFDMGGTSTDAALCPGRIPLTSEGEIGTMPLRLPMIDVHTVGAGGGSLARVDVGGALTVGPESAGAEPGPVCYGRGGTVPTVTDANLVLGRLDPAHFLGGRMALDERAARTALSRLAAEMSAGSPEDAAWGVVRVINAAMERAVRKISVERGHDPREFTLVAFGGAGPLHACELAERLGIPRVLVPLAPGVLSALGMLIADRVRDYSLTAMRAASEVDEAGLAELLAPLESRALAEMSAEGMAEARLERSIDMRYKGQSFEINVPAEARRAVPLPAFHELHRQRYGHSHPDEPVELVTVRVRAVGQAAKPRFEALPAGDTSPVGARIGEGRAWFGGAESGTPLRVTLFDRDKFQAGNRIEGPALVFQMDATTVVPPGWAGAVDRFGHLVLTSAPEK